jgi:hypothetical protein
MGNHVRHGWDGDKVVARLILVFQDEHPLKNILIHSPNRRRLKVLFDFDVPEPVDGVGIPHNCTLRGVGVASKPGLKVSTPPPQRQGESQWPKIPVTTTPARMRSFATHSKVERLCRGMPAAQPQIN